MDFSAIFFIGPQGSGKGTQADLLARRLGFYHWDTGSILRQADQDGSELGRRVISLISRGVLLDDDTLLQVAEKKLRTIEPGQGVVFDGIPRRMGQARFLLDFLKSQGRTRLATIYLNIPKEETVKRLLLRAKLEGRADDTRQAIEFRLQQYESETLPVLDLLRQETDFFDIDGAPQIEQVKLSIAQALNLPA